MSEHDTDALAALDDDAQGATTTDPTDQVEPVDTDSLEPSDDPTPASPQDRKLTNENRSLRKRLRETEARLKEREAADLSEAERLKLQLAEATETLNQREQRIRDLALATAVNGVAARLGITDADAALKLMDQSDLDWDDDAAAWVGVDDALRALAQEKPYLVAAHVASAAGTTPNAPRRRSTLTVDQLKGMTQAEIDALPQDELMAVLQGK